MTAGNTTSSLKQAFAEFLGEQEVPAWLAEFRRKNLERFLALGFPGRKDEDWRYTQLTKLSDLNLTPAKVLATTFPAHYQLLKNDNAPRLVFVNGWFDVKQSSPNLSESGLTISPLANELKNAKSAVRNHLIENEIATLDSLRNLNAAFLEHGVYIHVAADHKITRPVQLIHIYSGDSNPANTQTLITPRHIVVLDHHAELSLSEFQISDNGQAYLANAVTDIVLGEGAKLTHNHVQLESALAHSIGNTHVRQQKLSRYESLHFSFGAHMLRHNLHVLLEGEGASTSLNGLYAVPANHHIDHHTFVEHLAPRTESRQVYKGVIQELGKSVFNGKVHVHKNAQLTNAAQLNKNLLLGAKAEANTKPELIIQADDVKCSHGATVGQLSPEEVFYLQSRAIPKTLATQMLVRGFAQDVLNRIEDEILRGKLLGILKKEFL